MNRQIDFPKSLMTLCLTTILCFGHLTLVSAQEELQIKVYQLRNTEAKTALDVASTMLEGQSVRMSADHVTNSLIVSGNNKNHEMIETLLNRLDQENSKDPRFVEAMHLSKGTAEETAGVVQTLLANDNTEVRIAVNEELDTLIVSGSEAEVAIVREIIKKLGEHSKVTHSETKAANCVVRVTWLIDSSPASAANYTLQEPHDSLASLVQSLEQNNSFNATKVLTTLQTCVQLSQGAGKQANEFNNSSVRTLAKRDRDQGSVSIKSVGTVKENSNGKYTLDISLELQSHATSSIKTSIVLPKNHPVAFSISDVGEFRSAIVVEILDAD